MDAASHHLTRVISHGMGADPVISDWPALTSAEVARVLRHYPGVGQPLRLEWHSPRPFSAACVMQTESGPIIVKRHHVRVRDVAALGEEHRFAAHLQEKGLPVSCALATASGATALADDYWTYEVFALAAGVDLYREALSWTPFHSCAHAWSAGQMLSRLHQAAVGYEAPARAARPLVASFTIFSQQDPVDPLQAYIAQRPAIADYLEARPWRGEVAQHLLPWHAALKPYLDEFVPLWTHNDWHASNLLWSDASPQAQVQTVLDFGLCDRTTALHDLATAIERNIVEWLAIPQRDEQLVHLDLLDALLDGYAAQSPLSARQLRALAALLPLVHAEFALAELDYFHGVTQSAINAALAYDAYFLGHAAWFHSAEGQRLLAHLYQRADALEQR
ncbi:aminoglycoside phosphotransferase family protein [Herbaspirillum seropedicae]|uniref:phosphotransferase enzyme family protein n=1 Tax=Herbaspirillum seropedicae TaxID=964 RepID=UPI001123E036|nr:phosphotransferase [Herbaspirillum seropedicae]QDD63476.1 aminoglycoside phosphotransferase family protein [Herbaspirillum seropedicae]